MSRDEYMLLRNEYQGYCTVCRVVTNDSGVEPDAEGYECDACGALSVMGIEQAATMSLIDVEG